VTAVSFGPPVAYKGEMTRTSGAAGVLAISLCVIACTLPAVADAGRLPIPPNQPEADEYTPSVPDGEGNSAPDRTRDPVGVLDEETLRELDRLGETGAGVATLAASTAPGRPGSGSRSQGGGSASPPGASDGSAKASARQVGNVTAASYVPSEDGLGTWLWVIVAAAVLSAAIYAIYLWSSGRRS
jgi:hypothetical protein